MLLRFLQISIWQSFLPGKLDISTHWILHWIEEDSIYVGDVFVGCRSFIHLRLCLWSVTHPRYYSTGGGSFSRVVEDLKCYIFDRELLAVLYLYLPPYQGSTDC